MTRRYYLPGRALPPLRIDAPVDDVRAAIAAGVRSAKGPSLRYYFAEDGLKLVGYVDDEIYVTTASSWVNSFRCWLLVRVTSSDEGGTRVLVRIMYSIVASLLALFWVVAAFAVAALGVVSAQIGAVLGGVLVLGLVLTARGLALADANRAYENVARIAHNAFKR